jgi:hypothetical protein
MTFMKMETATVIAMNPHIVRYSDAGIGTVGTRAKIAEAAKNL